MRNALVILSIVTLLVLWQAGCTVIDSRPAEQRSSAAVKADASVRKHCFRNEYPFGDAMDVEELIVVIDGHRVTGEYNWVPAYKDRRLGRFTGTLHGNTINADYAYQQEGQSATTAISITLEEQQATVKGGPRELGLDRSLRRAAC